MRGRLAVLMLVLGPAGFARPAHGEVFLVPGDFPTIRAALDSGVLADGDVVELVAARYSGPDNRDLDPGGLAITIRSAGGDAEGCVIDCAGAGRGFAFQSGEGPDTVIEGLTVQGGSAAFGGAVLVANAAAPRFERCRFVACTAALDGGAVYVAAADPRFIDCRFEDNVADRAGGGLWILRGAPELTGCRFERNVAADPAAGAGGAIYAANAAAHLLDCTIAENEAGALGGGLYAVDGPLSIEGGTIESNVAGRDGGGIYLSNGTPTISGTTIRANTADEHGGGIAVVNAVTVVTRCRLLENTAGPAGGGGLALVAGEAMLVNCLLAGNLAPNEGGGLLVESGMVPLVNCTVVENTAFEAGGGVHARKGATIAAANCILWYNAGGSIGAAGGTVTARYCDVEAGWPGEGNIDVDPDFVDAAAGDWRLGAASPCTDAGDNGAVPQDVRVDLEGHPRFVDDPARPDTGLGDPPFVDLGAHERQSCPADLDASGEIGFADLLEVLSDWGPCAGCPADLDGNGTVGFPDLLDVLSDWGPCPGG